MAALGWPHQREAKVGNRSGVSDRDLGSGEQSEMQEHGEE